MGRALGNRKRWAVVPLLALLAVLTCPAGAGETDLVTDGTQGVVAVSLPVVTPSPGPPPQTPLFRDERRTAYQLVDWIHFLLIQEIDNTLSEGRKTRRRARILSREVIRTLRTTVLRQIARPAGSPRRAGGRLGVFATVQAVTHVGLTLSERLVVTATLAGRDYSAVLDKSRKGTSDPGELVQVRYNGPDDPASGGVLFAALVRESIAPEKGVLLLVVLDRTLLDLLDDFGITNETVDDRPVSIPFGITFTPELAGTRFAPDEALEAGYSARRAILGLATPPYMRNSAQNLLASYGLPYEAGHP